MNSENPYAAPKGGQDEPGDIIYENGYAKILTPAKLPTICLRCGSRERLIVQQKNELTYISPGAYFWLILGPIGFGLIYLIFRRKVQIEYYRCLNCSEQFKKWSLREKISWSIFAISIISCFFLPSPATYMLAPIFASFLFALFCATRKDPGLSVTGFEGGYFILKGVPKVDV